MKSKRNKKKINLIQSAFTCSKLTIKTPERRHTYFTPCSSVSIVNFEHDNADWLVLILTFVFNELLSYEKVTTSSID